MKNKIGLIISVVLLATSGVFFVRRYKEINANNVQVIEKTIRLNQLVHAHNIDFKIYNSSLKTKDDEVELRVKMYIKQHGNLDFGQKKNNPNYIENMWFEAPYSLSNSIVKAYDKNGKNVTYLSKLVHAEQPVTLVTTLPKKEYDSAEKTPRFTFIVPDGKQYVKYSLLIS